MYCDALTATLGRRAGGGTAPHAPVTLRLSKTAHNAEGTGASGPRSF